MRGRVRCGWIFDVIFSLVTQVVTKIRSQVCDSAGANETGHPWAPTFATYGGAFVLGAILVSFPASSAYLKDLRGFSDMQYGSIYLPQLVTAIAGAIMGGMASSRWDLQWLYRVSLVCFFVAQILLTLSGWMPFDIGAGTSLLLVMIATGAFGFGFGGGPLNGLVVRLFPRTPSVAITALHMCAGAGLTIAPFLMAECGHVGYWTLGPLVLAVLTLVVLVATFIANPPSSGAVDSELPSSLSAPRDASFWCLAIAAVAYSIAEGTFSNWAILYSRDDIHLSPTVAAATLTAFWGSLTVGRLIASVLALRVSPQPFLKILPFLMIAALLALRSVDGAVSTIGGFAAAGFACSAFFPMLVGYAAMRRSGEVSWIAATLTAAMMVGVGLGSYAIGAFRAAVGIRDLYLYAAVCPIVALASVFAASHLGSMKGSRCWRRRVVVPR